jgi:hypothetical protein
LEIVFFRGEEFLDRVVFTQIAGRAGILKTLAKLTTDFRNVACAKNQHNDD